MSLREKDKFVMEKRSEDHQSYEASDEWQFRNQSIGTAESFSPGLWNHPTNPQVMGFCETGVQSGASTSNSVPIGKPVAMASRLEMGGVFRPASLGVLPPSLPQFPADSAFIERAARFSCFNGGSFGGAVSPFGSSESLSPYSNHSKGSPGGQIQKGEMSRSDAFNDATMSVDRNSGSPMKDAKGSFHSVGVSNNDSGEPEFSGIGQEGTSNLGNVAGDSSSRALGDKKRKRFGQDIELGKVEGTQELPMEAMKENDDGKQRAEHNSSTMAIVKPSGKQPTNTSELPKDDCIHMRARRGQATNSHSLAERVRREKISERMKFLQDLVPGCSKVTGKAVMLDEIINYVQSLQRQVEFLSMKLATVNPRLDFNIEGILAKDFLQHRGGPSSAMGFSHDMVHPQLHLPHQGLMPPGMPDLAIPSDALRRALSAQLIMTSGYKDPAPQMPNAWDDALQNAIQMNFGTNNPPHNTQD